MWKFLVFSLIFSVNSLAKCQNDTDESSDSSSTFIPDFDNATNPDTGTSIQSCGSSELNYPARVSCCKKLNKQRKDFTSCCLYPMLVVFASQRQKCAETCAKDGIAPTNCCILNCCLQKLKIMTEDPQDGINPEFMARSYLLSVYNDTTWTYPIMSSVSICYNKNAIDKKELENEENMGCDGLVPKYFYDVVDCAYNMNFVNCPYWNPSNDSKCDFTRQFVIDCIIKNPKEVEPAINLI